MKKLLSAIYTPTKKNFIILAGIQLICIAVLWCISESRKDYTISGVFSLFTLTTSLLMWRRVKPGPDERT